MEEEPLKASALIDDIEQELTGSTREEHEEDSWDEESGWMKIWYEVWRKIQKVEPEIEQLSVEIQDLEFRRSIVVAQLKWADSQRETAETGSSTAKQQKKFMLFQDKRKIAELDDWATDMRDRSSEMRKQERTLAEQLKRKPARLNRLVEQRDNLYKLLQSLS
ncbi:MAG: hypothetical protein SVY53_00565 [Chloroflexota bacterium]|nr:hypothetical protein [Chloroflexota bacterium]